MISEATKHFALECEAGSIKYFMGSVWDVELPEQVLQVEGIPDYAFAEENYIGFRLARDSGERS
ncbi:hypothetical protein EBZ80_08605 [bacterium]|nr:hypothetical protein [bacterium]